MQTNQKLDVNERFSLVLKINSRTPLVRITLEFPVFRTR